MKNSLKWLIALSSWMLCLVYAALSFPSYWPSNTWWIANLIQMSPLWLLWGPILILIVFSVFFSRAALLPLLFAGALQLLYIEGFQLNGTDSSNLKNTNPYKIRILTANLGGVKSLVPLKELVRDTEPDLVFLQEVYSARKSALKEQVFLPNEWNIEFTHYLGLASKEHTIIGTSNIDRRQFDDWGAFLGIFELRNKEGREFSLYNVHLESPRDGITSILKGKHHGIPDMISVTDRQYQESKIAHDYIKKDDIKIIAGDFNLRDSSPIFQYFWGELTSAFNEKGYGYGFTKHTQWHGARIDHILVNPRYTVINAYVGPTLGGDHRPLIADIIFDETF